MTRCPKLVESQQVLGIVYISGGGIFPALKSGHWKNCEKNWNRNFAGGKKEPPADVVYRRLFGDREEAGFLCRK